MNQQPRNQQEQVTNNNNKIPEKIGTVQKVKRSFKNYRIVNASIQRKIQKRLLHKIRIRGYKKSN